MAIWLENELCWKISFRKQGGDFHVARNRLIDYYSRGICKYWGGISSSPIPPFSVSLPWEFPSLPPFSVLSFHSFLGSLYLEKLWPSCVVGNLEGLGGGNITFPFPPSSHCFIFSSCQHLIYSALSAIFSPYYPLNILLIIHPASAIII